jgi:hypothetical protein
MRDETSSRDSAPRPQGGKSERLAERNVAKLQGVEIDSPPEAMQGLAKQESWRVSRIGVAR